MSYIDGKLAVAEERLTKAEMEKLQKLKIHVRPASVVNLHHLRRVFERYFGSLPYEWCIIVLGLQYGPFVLQDQKVEAVRQKKIQTPDGSEQKDIVN